MWFYGPFLQENKNHIWQLCTNKDLIFQITSLEFRKAIKSGQMGKTEK